MKLSALLKVITNLSKVGGRSRNTSNVCISKEQSTNQRNRNSGATSLHTFADEHSSKGRLLGFLLNLLFWEYMLKHWKESGSSTQQLFWAMELNQRWLVWRTGTRRVRKGIIYQSSKEINRNDQRSMTKACWYKQWKNKRPWAHTDTTLEYLWRNNTMTGICFKAMQGEGNQERPWDDSCS